jgi:hypothetical protein
MEKLTCIDFNQPQPFPEQSQHTLFFLPEVPRFVQNPGILAAGYKAVSSPAPCTM